jgi:hypothetical protein
MSDTAVLEREVYTDCYSCTSTGSLYWLIQLHWQRKTIMTDKTALAREVSTGVHSCRSTGSL